jgi:hypothetical protein
MRQSAELAMAVFISLGNLCSVMGRLIMPSGIIDP